MKIPIFCLTCSIGGKSDDRPLKVVVVRDDGRYEAVCNNGHSIIILLQQLKFEVLFDIGAYAIADGYYREAVSSFTSSLERFFEFAIRVILHNRGVTAEVIDTVWRQISNQSERQLGAFIVLYSSEFQSLPRLLTTKDIKFRNDVIHKGKIPQRNEAVIYGNTILCLVRPILRKLVDDYSVSAQQAISDHLTQCRNSSADPNKGVSIMSVETILSLSIKTPGHDERSLEDAIANLQRW
jgi:hypothetical protein